MKVHRYEDIDPAADPWASYLWGAAGDKVLDPDIDHLIEELTDDMDKPEGTLTLTAWVRHEIDESEVSAMASDALRRLYEDLSERYSNPEELFDEEPSEEDERRTAAWVKEIVAGFRVWSCDGTDQVVEVDVRKWTEKRAPHWQGGEGC